MFVKPRFEDVGESRAQSGDFVEFPHVFPRAVGKSSPIAFCEVPYPPNALEAASNGLEAARRVLRPL
jgi:hypothetical protein